MGFGGLDNIIFRMLRRHRLFAVRVLDSWGFPVQALRIKVRDFRFTVLALGLGLRGLGFSKGLGTSTEILPCSSSFSLHYQMPPSRFLMF